MAIDQGYAAQDGRASAPAYGFLSAPTTGFYRSPSGYILAVVGGAHIGVFGAASLNIRPYKPAVWGARSRTLTAAEAGQVFVALESAAFTLPLAASCSGARFTIITGVASGTAGISFVAAGTDTLNAKTASAGGTAITGATSLTNSHGSDVIWDRMEVESDGVSKWIGVEQSGTWA